MRLSMVLNVVAATSLVGGVAGAQVTKESVPGVTNFSRVETTIACAGATTPAAVAELKRMGYASIINLGVFALLLMIWRRQRTTGQVLWSYILFYAIYRFGIEFLRNLPTVWDESIVLSGEVGKSIVVARRSGVADCRRVADHAHPM